MSGAEAIEVTEVPGSEPYVFEVVVHDAGSASRHRVTLRAETHRGVFGGHTPLTDCVRAAFLFPLEREPKESILDRFDVTVISRYFPEFEREIAGYLTSDR